MSTIQPGSLIVELKAVCPHCHEKVTLMQPQIKRVLYNVWQSLANLMFGPQNHLASDGLLQRDDLARKIKDSKTEEILLEDAEYQLLASAVKGFLGYTQNEVELVKRVLDAKSVEVEEVKEIKRK